MGIYISEGLDLHPNSFSLNWNLFILNLGDLQVGLY
jgi:hypothetical protein